MKVFIVCLTAVLLVITMKILRIGLNRLLNRYTGLVFIEKVMLALEPLIWLVFIFWVTTFLFREKFFYTYLVYAFIFILITFLSWFLLKDIFAGMIFRIQHRLKTGTYIKAGDFMGQIKSRQLSYLEIITSNSQLLRVPYSIMINEVITEMAYPEALEEHIIHLRVDRSAGKVNIAESMLRSAIINTPWSNLKEEPAIKFLKEDDNGYFFDITLTSVTTVQMKYIQMALAEDPALQITS